MFNVFNLQTGEDKVEVETEGYDTPPPSPQSNAGNADSSVSSQGTTSTGYSSPTTQGSFLGSDSEASSEVPRKTRRLSELYRETEEIDLDEDELMLMGTEEPTNFSKAATEYNWQQAMKNEIDAVERNNTWKLSELPAGQKAIGLKWVFKLKKDTNGEVVKYKARIVAKGYVQ